MWLGRVFTGRDYILCVLTKSAYNKTSLPYGYITDSVIMGGVFIVLLYLGIW